MRCRVVSTAFSELAQIAEYITQDNPDAARAVVQRIEEIFARIRRFPEIARPVDKSGIRIFPVRPFPYLVLYSVEQDEIVVRNVRHEARRRSE